ncbi:MAG: glycosyltransferase family 4 protein [Rhodothermales bacterium]
MAHDRPLRVLVLAYYFPPMGLSGVQRIAKLVKYLPENGVDVTVLTVHPGAYFAFDETLEAEVNASGATIVRTRSLDPTQWMGGRRTVGLPAESRRSRLSRAAEWIFQPDNKIGWYPFAVKEGRRILDRTPHDLIYATAPPYTSLLVGAHLARACSLPLVLDFRDDWVGNPRHTYPTEWHKQFAVRMEGRVLEQAERIHVVNRLIGDQLATRHPGASDRIFVVPQGFDPDDFASDVHAQSSVETRDDHLPDATCTFLYSGIFYDVQRPDVFLRAFAAACAASPAFRRDARARFAGLVPPHMDRLVGELGIAPQVEVLGYLDHDAVVRNQLDADVLWMTIGRRVGSEGISTGKLYEYLGAGKPILGLVPEGVARETLEASGIGYVCDPDSVEEVAAMLLRLFGLWQEHRLPGPAPATFLETYNRCEQARQMAHIFQSLVPFT